MPTLSQTLELDAQSIDPNSLSMPALMRELDQQKKPNWLLRLLMNALESKRQSKGMGWSRPWNKTGLNVFSTHKFNTKTDDKYLQPILSFIKPYLEAGPESMRRFALELLSDPSCMGFTFYHNSDRGGQQHEGFTLSFGRKVPGDRSKRDRLDIILEDLRIDGEVDQLVDRIRIYLCPWEHYQDNKQHHLIAIEDIPPSEQESAQFLYKNCIDHYHIWKKEEAREWTHWSARFIDYFGPRSFIPQRTSFS